MIYTSWEEVIGKTIERVEQYYKEFDLPGVDEQSKHWDVLFFNDGVLIQEFTSIRWERGEIGFIDSVNKKTPPPQQVIDIIEKYWL